VTDELLEMNHVHFLVAPRIEKSRNFSAHVVNRQRMRIRGERRIQIFVQFISWIVMEEGGKSNAINLLVHRAFHLLQRTSTDRTQT